MKKYLLLLYIISYSIFAIEYDPLSGKIPCDIIELPKLRQKPSTNNSFVLMRRRSDSFGNSREQERYAMQQRKEAVRKKLMRQLNPTLINQDIMKKYGLLEGLVVCS